MAESWLIGRKDISLHMGVCWDTVRKWKREYGCPVHVSPGGRPAALPGELDKWLVAFSEGIVADAESRTEDEGTGESV